MSAPMLTANLPFLAAGFAARGMGAVSQGGEPRPLAANDRVPEDSTPRAASLSEFHVVLVMPAGPARDALAMGLWDAGMLVTTFRSPHEAEGVLVGEAVHVVLIDLTLGPTMAPQTVWWLNAVGRGGVKVVCFGDSTPDQSAWLVSQGVSHCVPRPGNPAVFGRQLGEAMGFQRLGWR